MNGKEWEKISGTINQHTVIKIDITLCVLIIAYIGS